jgi:8-oxo-dGTP pyrophosphatase MutT (NUDIX family)
VRDCRIFTLDEVRYAPPDRGADGWFYVLDTPDWINVIPVTAAGEVVLVRQFRFGIDEVTLEIPGGMCDVDEHPLAAAQRELREETGYTAAEWIDLGWVHPNPPIQTNRCFTYLAQEATRVGEPQPDPNERIEVVTRPLSSVPEMIDSREISHALVLAAFKLLDGHERNGPQGS